MLEHLKQVDFLLSELKTQFAKFGNKTYRDFTQEGYDTFHKICKALFLLRKAIDEQEKLKNEINH